MILLKNKGLKMNQNGFENDAQEQYYLELERQKAEDRRQEDHFQSLLESLDAIAQELGYETAISFLRYQTKEKTK